jgi:hypothetical protein
MSLNPEGMTSRIIFGDGVSADGILSAKAASICERRTTADGIRIRLIFA